MLDAFKSQAEDITGSRRNMRPDLDGGGWSGADTQTRSNITHKSFQLPLLQQADYDLLMQGLEDNPQGAQIMRMIIEHDNAALEKFISRNDVMPDFTNSAGLSPVMVAAAIADNNPALEILCNNLFIDPARQTADGWTALQYAAYFCREENIKTLLRFQVDFTAANNDGMTAYDLASDFMKRAFTSSREFREYQKRNETGGKTRAPGVRRIKKPAPKKVEEKIIEETPVEAPQETATEDTFKIRDVINIVEDDKPKTLPVSDGESVLMRAINRNLLFSALTQQNPDDRVKKLREVLFKTHIDDFIEAFGQHKTALTEKQWHDVHNLCARHYNVKIGDFLNETFDFVEKRRAEKKEIPSIFTLKTDLNVEKWELISPVEVCHTEPTENGRLVEIFNFAKQWYTVTPEVNGVVGRLQLKKFHELDAAKLAAAQQQFDNFCLNTGPAPDTPKL